jgi:DNA-binding response OmpR family regulator
MDAIYTYTYHNNYDLYIVNFYYHEVIKTLRESGDEIICIFIDDFYNIYNLKESFKIGDDYLVKPLNPIELKTRVQYQYKKLYKYKKDILNYKDMYYHIKSKQLFKNKVKVKISPSETKLLELFLCHIEKPILFSFEI